MNMKNIEAQLQHNSGETECGQTRLDGHAVTGSAPAVPVLRRDGGSVVEPATQVSQIAPGLGGDALVPVAVGTHGRHLVELAEAAAVVPRHGGHVVAAAHAGLQVLGDAGRWGVKGR